MKHSIFKEYTIFGVKTLPMWVSCVQIIAFCLYDCILPKCSPEVADTDVNVMKDEQIVVKARKEGIRTNSH